MSDTTRDDLQRQLDAATARCEELDAKFPSGDEFRDNAAALEAHDEMERLKERIAALRDANA